MKLAKQPHNNKKSDLFGVNAGAKTKIDIKSLSVKLYQKR